MITVVSYDVCDPRRLRRLHKFLKEFGINTQKSVFECDIERDDIKRIKSYCNKNLMPNEDAFRIYQICSRCMAKVRISGLGLKILNAEYKVV